jgi:hypothetical protein
MSEIRISDDRQLSLSIFVISQTDSLIVLKGHFEVSLYKEGR